MHLIKFYSRIAEHINLKFSTRSEHACSESCHALTNDIIKVEQTQEFMAFTAGTVGGLMVGFGIIQVGITLFSQHKFKNNYFHVLYNEQRFFLISTGNTDFLLH